MGQEKQTFSAKEIELQLQEFLKTAKKPLVVIVGNTASGKTGLSISLAKKMNEWKGTDVSEVINADSRQFYKTFDIGTAKIKKDEMENIPHHMIDVVEPSERITISWFKDEATKIIAQMYDRNHIPILVGGSMLYVSSIIDGLMPLPERSEELREKLTAEYDLDRGVTLHHRLQHIDPAFAKTTSPNNVVHLIRAMEIYELTGKSPSSIKMKSEVPYDLFIIGCKIDAAKRKDLIEKRTAELFKQGWIEEVRMLIKNGVTENDPAMESVGYREILGAIKSGSINKEELTETITKKTMHYAKRQLTWWKRDERIRWLKK